jgi:nucleoside-diphosphate-sugar epimerase
MASRILHYQDIVTTSPASTVELIAYEPCVKTHPINLIQAPFTAALRIVITGGAGFLGSHMCKELVSQGHQVIVLDTLICSSRNNIAELENSPHFAFYNVDVTKPYDIAGPIDLVVHLASCPSPEFYYNNPIETLMSGLQGTKYALELALRKNARFMIGSTSEVYGDPEVSPQCEEYPGRVSAFGKRSQYDQSKRGAETLIKLYFERHNIDIRIARIFNTYGPAMALHDGRVVTNFIAAILEDKPVTVYGDGLQTRSFAYASDTVDGLIGLAFTDRITECPCIDQRIFNVGTPQEFTIKELADEINLISLKYLSKPAHIRYVPNIDPDDPKKRNPDITKINKLIGYEPLVRLKEGLEKTFLFFYHRAH